MLNTSATLEKLPEDMTHTYRTVARQALHYFVRPHEAVPSGPVACAAAWRGDALERDACFSASLDPRDLAEIEAALARARRTGKPLGALEAEDFPLPGLAERIARWRDALRAGIGVVVVRGVPVTRWSEEDCERFFWCFGRHLGRVGAQNRDNELLGHVRDLGGSYDDPSTRGYKTSAKLDYHCDAADVVGLLCLKTARTGGRSRFVSSVTVWNELLRTKPDLARRMFEPLALDTRGDGGLDFFPIEPCRFFGGQLRTFYHADYFRTAERQPGAPRLTVVQREMLDAWDAIASTPGIYYEMDLDPGDIQLLSNHTVLHSRSDYEDWPEPERKRHLLRLWLSLPDAPDPRAWPSMARQGVRLLGALGAGRLRKRLRARS